MTKQTNKQEKPAKAKKTHNIKQFGQGVFQLFVVGSIGFMAYIVITGMSNPIAQALTAPALIWAGLVLVNRFTK